MEKLLTLREVSEILRCTPRTVYQKVKQGDLVACKIGDLRFRKEDIEDFLTKCATKKQKTKMRTTKNRGVNAVRNALRKAGR